MQEAATHVCRRGAEAEHAVLVVLAHVHLEVILVLVRRALNVGVGQLEVALLLGAVLGEGMNRQQQSRCARTHRRGSALTNGTTRNATPKTNNKTGSHRACEVLDGTRFIVDPEPPPRPVVAHPPFLQKVAATARG